MPLKHFKFFVHKLTKSRWIKSLKRVYNEEGALKALHAVSRVALSVLETQWKIFLEFFQSLPKVDGPIKFSILVPTYRPDLKLFRKAIDTALAQTYQNFEICICDDASGQLELKQMLESLQRQHPTRIRWTSLAQNGHISKATNAAAGLATGDWVAFLDHDDVLAPSALAEIYAAIQDNPSLQYVFTSEDIMSLHGVRSNMVQKQDFSWDLLRSVNYICHFTSLRKDLFLKLGGFRVGFEGSQDWDLALRVGESIPLAATHYIPKCLYHWRMALTSTSADPDTKPYAWHAAKKAVEEHLTRVGVKARVDFAHFMSAVKLTYEPPQKASVLVLMTPWPEGEPRVSETRRTGFLEIEAKTVSGGAAMKEALDSTKADYVAFIHPSMKGDLEGFLSRAIAHMHQDSHVGCVMPLLVGGDGRVIHGGIRRHRQTGRVEPITFSKYWASEEGPLNYFTLPRSIPAADLLVMVVRRDLFLSGLKNVHVHLMKERNAWGSWDQLYDLGQFFAQNGKRIAHDPTFRFTWS